MNLCPALVWTDLCDLVVLIHGAGLNLSLVVLFEIHHSILHLDKDLAFVLMTLFHGTAVISLITCFINICMRLVENLSSKLAISFASVMTSRFQRQRTFKARRNHTFIWSDLWFTSSLWTWFKYSHVEVVMPSGKNSKIIRSRKCKREHSALA